MPPETETTLQQWQEWIDASELGPAHTELRNIADQQAIQITLDPDSPRKSRTLRRWISGPLLVVDAVLGRHNDNDPWRWLHLRGRAALADGQLGELIIVTCPFAVASESDAIQSIDARIERQDVSSIVTDLVHRERAAQRR